MLPNFPRHMYNQDDDKDKKFKSHSKIGMQAALKPKKKEEVGVGIPPESTKSGMAKKLDDKDAEVKEATKEEEPEKEVKKPRYFPPRRLPNPFENAAKE